MCNWEEKMRGGPEGKERGRSNKNEILYQRQFSDQFQTV